MRNIITRHFIMHRYVRYKVTTTGINVIALHMFSYCLDLFCGILHTTLLGKVLVHIGGTAFVEVHLNTVFCMGVFPVVAPTLQACSTTQ